jgi:hypothetical protein
VRRGLDEGERGEERLLVVLCDQRLMLAAPSRTGPLPSALDADAAGAGSGCASRGEAARLTVTTEDEETDVLREAVRECEDEAAAGSCCWLWTCAVMSSVRRRAMSQS